MLTQYFVSPPSETEECTGDFAGSICGRRPNVKNAQADWGEGLRRLRVPPSLQLRRGKVATQVGCKRKALSSWKSLV